MIGKCAWFDIRYIGFENLGPAEVGINKDLGVLYIAAIAFIIQK